MECIKVAYPSKKKADRRIELIKKSGKVISRDFKPYKCPNCKKWHLGHDKYHDENSMFVNEMKEFKRKKGRDNV